MTRWILLVLAVLTTPGMAEAEGRPLAEARLTLKKWGLAYCLSETATNPAMKSDAGRAMGGYFQRGHHNGERAYDEVRAFYAPVIKGSRATGVSQADGQPLSLMTCLDAYESPAYDAVVKKQDCHVAK